MFSAATNSEVSGNYISGATDLGIYVNDGAGGTVFFENVIANNRIVNCVFGGIGLKRTTQRCTVANNQIYNCGNGITLEQTIGTDYSHNLTIIGNRLRLIGQNHGAASGRGIDLQRAHYSTVIGNRIEDVRRQGIFLQGADHCTVSGNTITHLTSPDVTIGHSIALTDRDSAGCNYNVITDNVCRNAGANSLNLNASVGSIGNIITNNQFLGAASHAVRLNTGWASSNRLQHNVMLQGAGGFNIGIDTGAVVLQGMHDNQFQAGGSGIGIAVIHATGSYVLSAGWGSTATRGLAAGPDGTDRRARLSVNAAGTGIAANPTVTLTFPTPYGDIPRARVLQSAGPTLAPVTWTTSVTQIVFTFNGTPIVGSYAFDLEVTP